MMKKWNYFPGHTLVEGTVSYPSYWAEGVLVLDVIRVAAIWPSFSNSDILSADLVIS